MYEKVWEWTYKNTFKKNETKKNKTKTKQNTTKVSYQPAEEWLINKSGSGLYTLINKTRHMVEMLWGRHH